MTGTEKLKPVLVGKYANPRCIKSINKANLPVHYRFNSTSSMDPEILTEWLSMLNDQFASQKRNVLLLLDNFRDHQMEKYSNITIKFYPTNCSSVLQPLNQGIIESFKIKYRTQLIMEKINVQGNEEDAPSIDVLSGINKIKVAWDDVKQKTIVKCFKKAAGENLIIEENAEDLNLLQELCGALNMEAPISASEYLKIDQNALADHVTSDDDIVSLVKLRNQPNEEREESENGSNDYEVIHRISHNEALSCIDALKSYFLTSQYDCSDAVNELFKMNTLVLNEV